MGDLGPEVTKRKATNFSLQFWDQTPCTMHFHVYLPGRELHSILV